MSYITYDYVCQDCQEISIKMSRRDEVAEITECEACGGVAERRISAQICRVSYPDGTNNRWQYAKERRNIQKAMRAARKAGQATEVARMKSELSDLSLASKGDRQAANICKVSTSD